MKDGYGGTYDRSLRTMYSGRKLMASSRSMRNESARMSSSPRFRVPRQQYSGLTRLLQLSEEAAQELIAVLRDTPPTRSRVRLASRISSKVKLSRSDVRSIVDLLVSLYRARAEAELTVPEFVEAVRQAMEDTKSNELRPPDGDWVPFLNRLTTLLQYDETFGITSKAGYLAVQFEHMLHNAELFTDIRPVFRSDLDDRPATIIVHNLKIIYHEGQEVKELFVALNSEQVRRFRALLDRAESKAARLQRLLEEPSPLQVLEDEAR